MLPSLVMNEMNSLTHSCMHSLASFAILAFSGSAVFMMRATGAKLRMLASDVAAKDEDAGAERATCCRGRELLATVSEDMTSKDRMGGGREQASEWTATRPDREEARCDASHGWRRRRSSCGRQRMRTGWSKSWCSVAHSDSHMGPATSQRRGKAAWL